MRKVLLALGAFVVVAAAAALPATAGTVMNLEVTIDPTSGEAGTVVTFTPTDPCPVNTGAATNAPGDTYAAVSLVENPSSPSDYVADTLADGSGDWTLDYTIPADEAPGEVTLYAFCLYEFSVSDGDAATADVPVNSFINAEYDPVVFTVTEPPASTTTTSTSTTSTTAAPAPTLVASPTNVFPGDTINVNATGFAPGSSVVITLESDPVNLGTFVASSAGVIATSIVVPTDFPAGNHTLKLTGTNVAGAVLTLTTGITVASRIQVAPTTAATVATTTATLPRTGSSITTPALFVGGALVLAGAGAVLAARRRRSTTR